MRNSWSRRPSLSWGKVGTLRPYEDLYVGGGRRNSLIAAHFRPPVIRGHLLEFFWASLSGFPLTPFDATEFAMRTTFITCAAPLSGISRSGNHCYPDLADF